MKAETEGVIKFGLEHQPGPAPREGETAALRAWFRICRQLELMGQDPARYEGCAYGNLSRRTEAGILVTCTQTAGRRTLSPEDFTLVERWSLPDNRLVSRGPCRPSSETLTHAMVYEAVEQARWVFHVHSPDIWDQAASLGLAATDPAAEYGTPEMARAVAGVIEAMGRLEQGILSMGGHADGILAWGATAAQAGCRLMATLASALACGCGSPTVGRPE